MRQRTDGFTLVELMVVVLIIGILVAVAVPVFKAARDNAEWNTCQANQRTILGAVEAFNASRDAPLNVSGGWSIPGGTGAFLSETLYTTQTFIPNYLKAAPRCPKVTRAWVTVPTHSYTIFGMYYLARHAADDGAVHLMEEAYGGHGTSGWSPGHYSHDPYAGWPSGQ